MDVKISTSLLREVATKHPQFWHAAHTAGSVEGDKLRLSQDEFQRLCKEHFGALAPGNLVHDLVVPVAKLLGKDDCDGCAERQLKLNAL